MNNLVALVWNSFRPPPIEMIYGFVLLFLLFFIMISWYLIQKRKARKSFDLLHSQYQFQTIQNIPEDIHQAIQYVIKSYFQISSGVTVSNICSRGKDKDVLYLFDITYTMRRLNRLRHRSGRYRTTWYMERVIAIPLSSDVKEPFFIGKLVNKYSRGFEKLLSMVHTFAPVTTGDSNLDDTYSLLINKDSSTDTVAIPFVLQIKPLLDKYLMNIPKKPVGQTTYLCILCFTEDYCFLRFDRFNTAIENFYHLAQELRDTQ